MLHKNVKETLLLLFLSLKQRRHLMVWITFRLSSENYKKEGENGNKEERKKGSFLSWNHFFENNNYMYNKCLLDIQKNIF